MTIDIHALLEKILSQKRCYNQNSDTSFWEHLTL